MLPPKVESYLVTALTGAPDLADYLLSDVSAAVADFRPDPERFTIREAISHVADWEPIWLGRMKETVEKDHPTLVGIDEGEAAVLGNYGERDWWEQTRLYAERRAEMLTFLKTLSQADWDRTATHTEIGPITVYEQAVLVTVHDYYHLQQFAQWRRLFATADGGV